MLLTVPMVDPVDVLYALNGSYGGISNMPNKVKKKTLEEDEQKETSTRGSTARYNERRSSSLANQKKKNILHNNILIAPLVNVNLMG